MPKTSENFKQLAKSQKFNKSLFDTVVPGFMIQGGKIEKPGIIFEEIITVGKESIYGEYFADESFAISHDRPGLLSMANKGPDTNGSAFFITL